MLKKLSLFSDIDYVPSSLDPSFILEAETTAELCYLIKWNRINHILKIETIWAGYKEPYTQEEISILEKGLSLEKKKEASLTLKNGSYYFHQINNALLTQENIINELSSLIKEDDGYFHLRYFKENEIEIITQFFFSI